MLAGALVAGCVSTGSETASVSGRAGTAKNKAASAQQEQRPNEPWKFPTLFGMFYSVTPRETVDYKGKYSPGTIVVKTKERYLYYVLGNGQAIRYNIAVGSEGYNWAGVSTIASKREWPDWTPTPNIIKRYPDIPRHMVGGPENPLGARALYLGASLYRIHGTNEPWKIGDAVSSGCIRLSNDDVIDLYDRARIGATVVVTH